MPDAEHLSPESMKKGSKQTQTSDVFILNRTANSAKPQNFMTANHYTTNINGQTYISAKPLKSAPLEKGAICPKCQRSHHIFLGATGKANAVFAACGTAYCA
jgi:hypothetical protein